jgi:peptidoglycan-N-acetylglucosamine deacetylase
MVNEPTVGGPAVGAQKGDRRIAVSVVTLGGIRIIGESLSASSAQEHPGHHRQGARVGSMTEDARWWAGIGWWDGGFELVVVDRAGAEAVPATRFAGQEMADLIEALRGYAARANGGLSAVIDSTNGMVDGHLVAAGVTVYRADPPTLGPRPVLGSVPAGILARQGVTNPGALHRLTQQSGALVGRVKEFLADIERSAPVERDLVRSGQCLLHGRRTVPEIALTFDDGPHPGFTPQVLELLKRYGIPATFFCVGVNAQAHRGLVERTVHEGHLVGNHTWSHPYLPDLTREQLLRQVDETDRALALAGVSTRLVRPPYGSRSPEVLRWLAEHGRITVLWDIDTQDWSAPGTEVIATEAAKATAGSVLLMHDAGGDRTQTVATLPRVIEDLLCRGYRFVRLDALSRSTAA